MIICCGEALIDMVPFGNAADGLKFEARTGGCPYNTAVAAGRLGADVAYLGRIGSDFLGDALAAGLANARVRVEFLARGNEPTTLAFVHHESGGDVRYAFYSNGTADRSFSARDIPSQFPESASFLMVGSISMLLEPAASAIEALAARESGRRLISLDPNVRPSLIPDRDSYLRRLERWSRLAAVVKLGSADLKWLFPGEGEESSIRRFLDLGATMVVVTRGSHGAVARTRRHSAEVDAFRVVVVDTIGAGDCFHAALLSRLNAAGVKSRQDLASLDDSFLKDALHFSSAAAAITCSRRGADSPTAEDVARFLK
jgi:fructokinase